MQALLCQPDALLVDDFLEFLLVYVFHSLLFHSDKVLEFQLVVLFEGGDKVIDSY